jgi:hypothetical protein
MRRLPFLVLTSALLGPALPALAQMGAPTPLTLDLGKVPIGSWSEYAMTIAAGGGVTVKSRWALVARDANSNTLEMSAEGPPLEPMGGKMTAKLVLVPDPVKSDHPVKQMVMKLGDRDPMEMPLDMPGMPAQKFQKPDPKKLVGKESVKVTAGSFKANHYRDVNNGMTIDFWTADTVQPLGLVKLTTQPQPGAQAQGGQPIPSVTLQLTGRGKDARPTITKPAKPFDPAAFAPPPSGRPPSAPSAPSAPKK